MKMSSIITTVFFSLILMWAIGYITIFVTAKMKVTTVTGYMIEKVKNIIALFGCIGVSCSTLFFAYKLWEAYASIKDKIDVIADSPLGMLADFFVDTESLVSDAMTELYKLAENDFATNTILKMYESLGDMDTIGTIIISVAVITFIFSILLAIYYGKMAGNYSLICNYLNGKAINKDMSGYSILMSYMLIVLMIAYGIGIFVKPEIAYFMFGESFGQILAIGFAVMVVLSRICELIFFSGIGKIAAKPENTQSQYQQNTYAENQYYQY